MWWKYGSLGLFTTGHSLYRIILYGTDDSNADVVDPNSQVHANTRLIFFSVVALLLLLLLLILERRLVSDTSVVLKHLIMFRIIIMKIYALAFISRTVTYAHTHTRYTLVAWINCALCFKAIRSARL